jgi:beta-phosphoglucomutase-like phosphatase (HAD superfamily)
MIKACIFDLDGTLLDTLDSIKYYLNAALARQTWEQFVDTMDDHNKVAEWLNAMAECLFGEDDEEDTGFLAQKRKMDMERENNRKSAIRKKR